MRRDLVPGPDDLLCERCGYLLNGLPPDTNCPECGEPVADSTIHSPRRPPPWESGRDRGVGRFQATALSVLRSPRQFFRHLTSHGDSARSAQFGRLAILPALLFNTKTVIMHLFVMRIAFGFGSTRLLVFMLPLAPVVVTAAWLGFYAAIIRLTTLESGYWGMRLPADVVRRALHYDAVQVSLASLLPWIVSLAYLCLLIGNERVSRFATAYLYVLCGAVVVSAVYLFTVYATSMRSLMYANR